MPLVPSVTELVIAQLLYLNYQSTETITMYINSPGTNSPDGRAFSFDTEAFAIADTMMFVKPPIRTICVGQAFGTAAMLLSLGQKGNRFALPNASIMLNQPRSRARGQASEVAIKAREVLSNRRVANEILAVSCGKDVAAVEKDTSRVRYMSPEEAIDYGLIDQVLYPDALRVQVSCIHFVYAYSYRANRAAFSFPFCRAPSFWSSYSPSMTCRDIDSVNIDLHVYVCKYMKTNKRRDNPHVDIPSKAITTANIQYNKPKDTAAM
ncbi:hypothetical protein EON64_06695 [archaeon]|nr:MAG: hypothetical protein EON64_06695 [archaeon]